MIMAKLEKGLVEIYTGSGKGKTTAAMGLGLRAAKVGLKVSMFQFLKKKGTSYENNLSIPNFKMVCLDEVHPMFLGSMGQGLRLRQSFGGQAGARIELKKKILKDLRKVKAAMKSGRYDVIILDEIINCVRQKFLDERVVLSLIKARPKQTELVLTGRGASRRLIAAADYVTRLDKIKHPFDKGILARRGIEY